MAETLKTAALGAIAKLPDTATLDDIMYRLHVIEKVRKGQDAVKRGETVSTEELKKEVPADYIKEKSKHYNEKKYEEVMSKIPDVEPQDYDKL